MKMWGKVSKKLKALDASYKNYKTIIKLDRSDECLVK